VAQSDLRTMNADQVFEDDQLDSEWAQYVASLQLNDESRRNREKKTIVEREQETMNNLQRHIRGLSRARFVLTDAVSSDLFEDSSSSSDTEPAADRDPLCAHLTNGALHDLASDESDKESSYDSAHDLGAPDSDEDGVAPLPEHSSLSLHHSLSSLSRRSSRHIRSGVGPHTPATPLSALLEQQLSIDGSLCSTKDIAPHDDLHRDSEDFLESADSEDYEVNDSHSLLSANGSRDSQYECSGSDQDCDRLSSHCSNPSNDSSRKSEDEMPELQYDEELEALRRELNAFKRKNRKSSRLRRTKSREEILLSVLNIDQRLIDAEQLEKCAESAMTKYNTMAAEEKQNAIKRRSQSLSLSRSMSQSLVLESHRSELLSNAHLLQSVDDENPMALSAECVSTDFDGTTPPPHSMERAKGLEPPPPRGGTRPLADPYEEEWNGLDPDDYFWDDDLPEGDCFDDDELSVRDRRTQYLVVMAIDNGFCSISDLTHDQNELLLQHQDMIM